MSSAAYQPVSLPNGLSNDDEDEEQFQDEPSGNNNNRMEPLEIMDDDDANQKKRGSNTTATNNQIQLLRRVKDYLVWPNLSLAITIWLVCPCLIFGMVLAFQITGRIWTCVLFALHLTLALIKAQYHVQELSSNTTTTTTTTASNDKSSSAFPTAGSYSDNVDYDTDAEEYGQATTTTTTTMAEEVEGVSRENMTIPPPKGCCHFVWTSIGSLLDILLFGIVYPLINKYFQTFFIDYDGTLVYDWIFYYNSCQFITMIGWIIVTCRIAFGTRMIVTGIPASTYYLTTTYYMIQSIPLGIGKCYQFVYYQIWVRFKICFSTSPSKLFMCCWRIIVWIAILLSTIFLGYSIYSLSVHLGGSTQQPQPTNDATLCDPLDNTECCLPFPSFFHMQKDSSTDTGYRVNLNPDSFPKLRGSIDMDLTFLNELDGFSTMGPILFYLEGMKESHEVYKKSNAAALAQQKQPGITRLRGHEEIALSTTPYSTTLLLDVKEKVLVPHSAEIDYLEPTKPLVMIFPAEPLKHNTHYAVAVINATDAKGNRLSPTPGMTRLWESNENDNSELEKERKVRFEKIILPALEGATHKASAALTDDPTNWGGPFGSFSRKKDPGALQLMFDFQTISKKSQLGPVRAVRDGTLNQIKGDTNNNNWDWDDHARKIKQVEGNCDDDPGYPLARTIHGEIDVPWFLSGFGSGQRHATLDAEAVETGVTTLVGKAKFVVYIPCSLKRKALNLPTPQGYDTEAQPLRGVLEYGHGLFNTRSEASDDWLIKTADRNGFILMAMDWRGMSIYDYPMILKTMLAKPSLFESVRDNLIQGYANKYALQHFSQNGMLDREWFQFSADDDEGSDVAHTIPQMIPSSSNQTHGDEEGTLPSLFYGISQGGILGAGYVGLSGATGLITRAALSVPGTPFSLILSRSLQFLGYDVALLLNFYNNRDVRIFLVLAQMCWDSVEGSGVLGRPVEEPVPPMILQAGLGDAIVSTLAAERLARALNAQVLPHNPRGPIFGIPEGKPTNQEEPGDPPHTVLTEIKYQEDYDNLPLDDELTQNWNGVHICVRLEPVMQSQTDVFFTEGVIIDPCEDPNACVKKRAEC